MESQKQQTPDEWAIDAEATGKNTDDMASRFAHIKGWGIDADPDNEPTYPIKHWNGDDHKRLNYARPSQQPLTVEKLHSNERSSVSAVFGTSLPPAGLSGKLRRYAFRFSEGNWNHWLTLLFADRVNVAEGVIDDIKTGHVPNLAREFGWSKKETIRNIAIAATITFGILILLSKNKKRLSPKL
jgi:hypothetical protein